MCFGFFIQAVKLSCIPVAYADFSVMILNAACIAFLGKLERCPSLVYNLQNTKSLCVILGIHIGNEQSSPMPGLQDLFVIFRSAFKAWKSICVSRQVSKSLSLQLRSGQKLNKRVRRAQSLPRTAQLQGDAGSRRRKRIGSLVRASKPECGGAEIPKIQLLEL